MRIPVAAMSWLLAISGGGCWPGAPRMPRKSCPVIFVALPKGANNVLNCALFFSDQAFKGSTKVTQERILDMTHAPLQPQGRFRAAAERLARPEGLDVDLAHKVIEISNANR